MNIARKARHLAIVGNSGTGKTTLALSYILGGPHTRVIIADHEGEFAARMKIPLAQSWDEFFTQLETQRVVCLDITELHEEGSVEAFDEMCDYVLQLAKSTFEPRNMEVLLVMDEVQTYVSTQSMPPNFKKCLETGRKWMLDTLSISQRPNAINGAMKEQFKEMFFFRMQDENSHKFGEYFGLPAEEQDSLEDGEYIYMDMKRGKTERCRLWGSGIPKMDTNAT